MIQCHQLVKVYPPQLGSAPKQALNGISFELKQGQTLGMIGANGAGKSTCIRILMDFMRPTSGQVHLLGKSPQHPEIRKHIGYLPEIAHFPPSLTCMDLLKFAGTTCGMKTSQIVSRADMLLDRLKLNEARNRQLKSFSKGMQQRASFAMALIHNPDLLILDEPMSGLDPIGRAEIVSLIQDMKKQGKSILFCSHLLNDVERLADRIILLHHGSILLDENTSSIQQQFPSLEKAFLHTIQHEEAMA